MHITKHVRQLTGHLQSRNVAALTVLAAQAELQLTSTVTIKAPQPDEISDTHVGVLKREILLSLEVDVVDLLILDDKHNDVLAVGEAVAGEDAGVFVPLLDHVNDVIFATNLQRSLSFFTLHDALGAVVLFQDVLGAVGAKKELEHCDNPSVVIVFLVVMP